MNIKKILSVGLMLGVVSAQGAWAAAAQVPSAFAEKEVASANATQNESVLKKIAATHTSNKVLPIG